MCDNREQIIQIIKDNIQPLYPIKTGLMPKLCPQFKARAVIFDVYGTLIISSSGELKSPDYSGHDHQQKQLEKLMQKYRIGKSPVQISTSFQNQIKQAHKKLKKQGIDFPEVKYEDIWKTVTNIRDENTLKTFTTEYEMIVNPVYSMPHVSEIISYLNKKNIFLGIISNAQFFTPLILEVLLDRDIEISGFKNDMIFLSYKWNRAKPSQFLFQKAAEALNKYEIKPGETLYVGNDICSDIMPAQKAGFKTALFAGDKRSLRSCDNNKNDLRIEPDYILTDLDEIKICIGEKPCTQ